MPTTTNLQVIQASTGIYHCNNTEEPLEIFLPYVQWLVTGGETVGSFVVDCRSFTRLLDLI